VVDSTGLATTPPLVNLTPERASPAGARILKELSMGLFSRDIHSMDDLFVHGLQDIYYAENQILKSLPNMIEKAANGELKKGFQIHLGETRKQVQRLERVFRMHGKEPQGTSCPAIDGILEEADDIASDVEDKNVLDAAIIAAAQAVEHYEITRYGALIAWAKELGRGDCAAVLRQNLAEEKATDKKLTALAERRVNPVAERGTRAAAGRTRKTSGRDSRTAARSRRSGSRRSAKKSKRATGKHKRAVGRR
jgi:ferritin-like metal-binding protein YciE